MTTVAKVVDAIEYSAPPSLSESWDNVGLVVGDPRAEVQRVLLTIDCTQRVLHEAVERGAQMVIAYHPPIFEGLKKLHAGTVPFEAIRAGIAIYSPHTALDVAVGGTNDVLADVLGMTDRVPVRITRPATQQGLGRVGSIVPTSRPSLVERIKAALEIQHVLIAGPTEGLVDRVAVGAGACGDLIKDVIEHGAGLYLTGEVRHHDALRAAASGLTVVAALHSNSERITLRRLAASLAQRVAGTDFVCSTFDHDPFTIG